MRLQVVELRSFMHIRYKQFILGSVLWSGLHKKPKAQLGPSKVMREYTVAGVAMS